MKSTKLFFTLGCAAIALIISMGIYIGIQPDMVDFRGIVNSVSYIEAEDAFYINATAYEGGECIIKITNKTTVELSSGDKIYVGSIDVGDTVDVNFRCNLFLQSEDESFKSAKKITLYPKIK